MLDAAKARGLRSGENPDARRGNRALLLPRRKKDEQNHQATMPFAQVPDFMIKLRQLLALSARASS
ncbi:hypothetical protein [Novosphingobium aquae]|uniref:Uncharacterized protein n=1 Tax=Novosphingobium aquae TaxID=3133435 RepID=A0ABU8S9Q0_9SPHN